METLFSVLNVVRSSNASVLTHESTHSTMECFNTWHTAIQASLAVTLSISELMGVTTKGPNGILDSLKQLAACFLEWIKKKKTESPRSPVLE